MINKLLITIFAYILVVPTGLGQACGNIILKYNGTEITGGLIPEITVPCKGNVRIDFCAPDLAAPIPCNFRARVYWNNNFLTSKTQFAAFVVSSWEDFIEFPPADGEYYIRFHSCGGISSKTSFTFKINVDKNSDDRICQGNYDGANYKVMQKPTDGFIFNNCFYTKAIKGTVCPSGTSLQNAGFPFGNQCFYMNIPATGFIYSNNFYVNKNNGVCPPGSTDDTANCLLFSPPYGHRAFQRNGKWYVTPYPYCPPNSTYDGANCLFCCAPCGKKAFLYAGNWYYTK